MIEQTRNRALLPRWVFGILAALAAVSSLITIHALIRDMRSTPVPSIFYGVNAQYVALAAPFVAVIEPVVSTLCPGDSLDYEVTVDINEAPAMVQISETWCRASANGVCSYDMTTNLVMPILEDRHVTALAHRQIPKSAFFVPGHYELWHASLNSSSRALSAYRVPFEIRDDCR